MQRNQRRWVTTHNPKEIGNDFDLAGGKADGKRPAILNVVGGLVIPSEADKNIVVFALAAPSHVHGVGSSVVVIGGDDEHRKRGNNVFFAKFLCMANTPSK